MDIPTSEGPDQQAQFSSEATEAPTPALLNPTTYNEEETGRAPGEEELQSHWNVYVGVHMPHSNTKHKHRHKRRHSQHGRHGSSRGHHGSGHDHDGNGHDHHGNGHDLHSSGPGFLDINVAEGAAGRAHGDRSHSTDMGYSAGHRVEGPIRYHKSHSMPACHYTPPTAFAPESQMSVDPTTPSDPCDRVKFILGGDHDDQAEHHGDGATHSIFTELEELKYDESEQRMEWKETARWVKFEEDVEEGGNKWSKPHVATLSLHSLFELRSCIFKGTVLLDLQAENLAMISDVVLDNLVITGQLEEEVREKVRAALLQRHLHLNSKKDHGEIKILDHIKSLGEIGRHNSKDFDSLLGNGHTGSLFGSRNGSRRGSIMGGDVGLRNGSLTGSRLEDEAALDPECECDISQHRKLDSNFMKKIPPGSEASNVLVGEVDFLSHPIIAFVRLARGLYLGDLTEVPIPTRFIFIMLGPTGHKQRYHEIGRSIATLMSDEVFHEVAYKARNRGDLMAGIDEFLDKVTVLPPGEWDPQIRLEPPSKVPSQANRRNTVDPAKESLDVAKVPYKCKHCKTSMNDSNPIKWTKRPFRGLIRDITRCYGLYRSDFSESVSLQSVAALILIYFANITLAFTFGAFLSDNTDNTLGATETILAVGLGNLFYSIFSGQPLVVLGPTGPTLIFEQLVAAFCRMEEIPFLEFRFWIGLWTAIFMFVLVGINSSAITRLFTRFTEEIFTVLIGLVFIYEACAALWKIHLKNPYNRWIIFPTKQRDCSCFLFPNEESRETMNVSNATRLGSFWDDGYTLENCSRPLRDFLGSQCPPMLMENHDVFLMSVILFFGTFMFCIYFKKIRNSRFLRSYIRVVLSDFAVFIAVVVWVVIDVLAQVDTPKLVVPNVFESGVYTQENRTVIINPLGHGLPSWAPGAALLPAMLATILLFMDQHITAIIVNRKDNRLKKQPGYHLDLFLIGCLIFLHSLLGLPWVVGATILSISHVQSLFLYSAHNAPGERPKFIGVREQRVTLFLMAFLVCLSVMAYKVLILLPLPVLYGLILYLGVASLYGVQFIERLQLFFIPNKHKPDFKYLRQIPNRRIYIYTGIQIVFLLLLCIFQVYFYLKAIFPIMVVTLVIGRWLLGFAFSKHDLELLDDPIPDSLYCRPCRDKDSGKTRPHADLESHDNGSQDTLSNSDHYDFHGDKEEDAVTSEPLGSNGFSGGSGTSGNFPQQQHAEESFNLTHEVDKCDLWKNMVKNLDAPLPSPQNITNRRLGEGGRGGGGANMWTVTEQDYRELGTLEECDTDLESGPISATLDRGREEEEETKKGAFVFGSSIQTSSPALVSGGSRRGLYEVAGYDDGNVGGADYTPVLLNYRTTAV